MEKIIKVEKQDIPLRLDKYLKNRLKEFSREKIISFIKKRLIQIEGSKLTKPNSLVRGGEMIILDLPDISQKTEDLSLSPITLSPEPKILYEDKNLLVVNKPAGLVVHPTAVNLDRPSLAAWLIGKYPFLKFVGENSLRPGIVHRLDKDTSGVLVIAKNNPTFFYLKNLFKKRKIHKEYLALVKGEIKEDKGIVDRSIVHSRRGVFKRRIMYSRDKEKNKKGKTAITAYKVKRRYKGYTLLEVMPRTGRTHQIRVHLASIGYPVVNDKVYRKKKTRLLSQLPQHFLHAQKISFFSPSREFLEIEAPLPSALSSFLRTLTLK